MLNGCILDAETELAPDCDDAGLKDSAAPLVVSATRVVLKADWEGCVALRSFVKMSKSSRLVSCLIVGIEIKVNSCVL